MPTVQEDGGFGDLERRRIRAEEAERVATRRRIEAAADEARFKHQRKWLLVVAAFGALAYLLTKVLDRLSN